MNAHNLFQLWRENGERLPFRAALDSWSEQKGHYVLVEKIEVKIWPYGSAFGTYFFADKPGRTDKIDNAGTYRWRILPTENESGDSAQYKRGSL